MYPTVTSVYHDTPRLTSGFDKVLQSSNNLIKLAQGLRIVLVTFRNMPDELGLET